MIICKMPYQIIILIWLLVGLTSCQENQSKPKSAPVVATGIQWMSIEEAEEKMKSDPREIFVMVYANWCPHCKNFDKTTYQNPKVIAELNTKFYPVKINAHSNESMVYQGKTFTNPNFDSTKSKNERNSYHEILYEIQAGSIPSIVFIGSDFQVKGAELGFKEADELRSLMKMYNNG